MSFALDFINSFNCINSKCYFLFIIYLRNGLRPSRYCVTKDNVVVMASEVGVYDVDPADIVHKVSATSPFKD